MASELTIWIWLATGIWWFEWACVSRGSKTSTVRQNILLKIIKKVLGIGNILKSLTISIGCYQSCSSLIFCATHSTPVPNVVDRATFYHWLFYMFNKMKLIWNYEIETECKLKQSYEWPNLGINIRIGSFPTSMV